MSAKLAFGSLLVAACLVSSCSVSGNASVAMNSPAPGAGSSTTPTTAPSTGGSTAASSATVDVSDYKFAPASTTVAKGATVTWNFQGPAPHTSTSAAGSAVTWDSGSLGAGKSYSFTFNTPGTYQYMCTIHPNMKATIIVQ